MKQKKGHLYEVFSKSFQLEFLLTFDIMYCSSFHKYYIFGGGSEKKKYVKNIFYYFHIVPVIFFGGVQIISIKPWPFF